MPTHPERESAGVFGERDKVAEEQEMSSGQLLAEAGQFEKKAEIKATGSGLVFSATEESDQSHTFLSGWGRPFIHLFAGHSTNINKYGGSTRLCAAWGLHGE